MGRFRILTPRLISPFTYLRLLLFALLDIEDVLYRQYQRFITVPNSIFRFHAYLNQRGPIALSDGTMVRIGDLVISMHLWNSRLNKILANVPKAERRRRFLAEVESSLHVLADYLQTHPAFEHTVALRARTLLGYLFDDGNWPFDRFIVKQTWLTRILRFFMRLFLSRQHPQGFRRTFGHKSTNLQLVDFWISKTNFLTLYGSSAA